MAAEEARQTNASHGVAAIVRAADSDCSVAQRRGRMEQKYSMFDSGRPDNIIGKLTLAPKRSRKANSVVPVCQIGISLQPSNKMTTLAASP